MRYRVTLTFYVDDIEDASEALSYVEDNITAQLARDYDHIDTEEITS